MGKPHSAEMHLGEVGPPGEGFIFGSDAESMRSFARWWLETAAKDVQERGMKEAAIVIRRLKDRVK